MRALTLFVWATLVGLPWESLGQELDDALLFSRQQFHGSARFNAMGGAFTALGGDLGSIHVNPAGVGVFTRNEVGITLATGNSGIGADYYGRNTFANDGRLNANNLGIVFVSELNHPEWKTFNVGFSYTRTNDFNSTMRYEGTQGNHNFAQHLANQANSWGPGGTPLPVEDLPSFDPFQVYPAYQTYIIDYDNSADEYYTVLENSNSVFQQGTQTRRGRTSESMLSLGANYNDRVYFGLGLKVGSLVLFDEFRHTETPDNQESLTSHSYRTDLEVRGSSFSVSGGIIARPVDFLRFGVTVQTPHWYTNNEVYSTGMTSNLNGAYAAYAESSRHSFSSPVFDNRYNFHTPWRFGLGVAGVFGPKALLSVDYEHMNFGSAQFVRNRRAFSSYEFIAENEQIESELGGGHNIRSGFEYRLLPFSLRAGYSYFSNPVRAEFRNVNRQMHMASAGVGWRHKKVFIDAGFWYLWTQSQFALYNTGFNQSAALDIARHGVSFTFGYRY